MPITHKYIYSVAEMRTYVNVLGGLCARVHAQHSPIEVALRSQHAVFQFALALCAIHTATAQSGMAM